MRKKDSDDNPAALAFKVEGLERSVHKIELALYGENGTTGMAKDVSDIKSSLRIWGQLKTFCLGIASTVIVAVIVAVMTGAL